MTLIDVLKQQQQCDEEGIMCIVSRQAVDEAIAKITELEAENERLRQDAERYRWLKTQRHVTWAPHGQAFAGGASGDKLDAAIDALRGEVE